MCTNVLVPLDDDCTDSAISMLYYLYRTYVYFRLETVYSFKMADVKTEPLLIRPVVTVFIFISLVHNNCLVFCIEFLFARQTQRWDYVFIS